MVESRKRNLIDLADYELTSRFRSKKDFYTYLTSNCKSIYSSHPHVIVQYYLPPIGNVTKDFLRSVFKDEKKLMKMADCVPVNVPLYQEINVQDVQKMFSHHKEFMMHLPDRMAKGRQIDRTYFFTVLNTLEPEKLHQIISHA